MATEVSENEMLQCLLKSIEESIPINFDGQKKKKMGKVFGRNASIYCRRNRSSEGKWGKWCDNLKGK